MQADIEGAVRIARLAAGFDWSWTIDNLEDFGGAADWREERRSKLGTSFQTGLELQRNKALVRFDREVLARLNSGSEEVLEITVLVTDGIDLEDPHSAESLVDGFAQLSGRIAAELGPAPRRHTSIRPGLVWDLPKLSLMLEAGEDRLCLIISNPAYRRRRDESANTSERTASAAKADLSALKTWPEFVRALALNLALLRENSRLVVSASPGWAVTFVMDEFELKCIIRLKAGVVLVPQVPLQQRTRLVEEGWVAGTDRHGDHWERSVQWPTSVCDLRQLTESVAETLQRAFAVINPAELQIEVWQ